ncbi:MAG TPA: nucleoside-diphosphate kinase [Polyangiaceae bacterium]|nr:nucleoside-diphosphate kinase [Polyangiaceae bacterium]
MATERTLCIVKPDAVEKHKAGAILARLEEEGFAIVGLRRTHLTKAEAEGFYAVHRARPFFGELVTFMTRSPVVIAVLEREGAVAKYREVMGATDPAKATAGTLRKLFGSNVGENAVHGSDSAENAKIEIAYFFPGCEVAPSVQ